MTYKVQFFHAESAVFLNTNHESVDLESLRQLVSSETFDGVRCRIVDGAENEIESNHSPRPRKSKMTIDDIARMLNVPVTKRFEDVDMPGWTDPKDVRS